MTAPQPLQVFVYGPDSWREESVATAAEAHALLRGNAVGWVNVNSVADPAVVEDVGRAFGLHPLAVEDVQRVHQRPKVEPYEGYVYVVLRMVSLVADSDDPETEPAVETEQLSLFLGPNWVLTFQERAGDVFGSVRSRIRAPGSDVRGKGADHLAYRIIDSIVDSLFPVLATLGNRLESIEEEIEKSPTAVARQRLQDAKRDLVAMRRVLWPQRDALASLERLAGAMLSPDTRLLLRDPLDHTLRAVDIVEGYREVAADLRDLYLAEINTRTSEIMRVLTLVATIFIPLTFVAGVYGMNFERMPELTHPWGYPVTLGAMGLLATGMLVAFRRRGWLG